MKRIIITLLSTVIFMVPFIHPFVAYALDFDAELTFDSVFIVLSGSALGSGFALGNHIVVTNAHVIQDTSNVKITTYDGYSYFATVYCKNDELDIAVLLVPSANFKPLKYEDISSLKIGDDVFAIGAPNGMSYTLTKGTLSSNKRIINNEKYLQIDAALNEGNSGGPLLNSNGAVIGMNTMKIDNSEGLGLAIPIDCIIQYLKNNNILISEDGITDELKNGYDTEQGADFQYTERVENISESTNQQQIEYGNNPVLIAIICVLVICNIIMLLISLYYKNKWKSLKEEQSERFDFEIDILE